MSEFVPQSREEFHLQDILSLSAAGSAIKLEPHLRHSPVLQQRTLKFEPAKEAIEGAQTVLESEMNHLLHKITSMFTLTLNPNSTQSPIIANTEVTAL